MTSLRHTILLLLAGLLLYSCVSEPLDDPTGGGTTDKSMARITLAVTGDTYAQERPAQQAAAHRAAYPYHQPDLPQGKASNTADETKITNLHILIFDAAGAIATNKYFGQSDLNQSNRVSFETYPGKGMQIFAIANGDVNDASGDNASEGSQTLKEQLQKITTIAQLNEVLVKTSGDGLYRTDRLTMVGRTTVDIANPHTQVIALSLTFLAAKVTVNVSYNKPANSNLDINITGWDMMNIPARTYLLERAVVGGSTTHDAVNGSNAIDYLSTNNPTAFEATGTPGTTWTQTLYLFENRRGGRVERADAGDPAEKYPNMAITDSDPRGKAWWAPAGATYMLIYGTATENGRTNNVVYKIYLGENVFNDYNTARGKYCTFNVKITGIREIDIDSTVDWGNSSFMVTPYGDLTKMDAHADFRVLRIGATAVDATTPGYATVEVLNEDGTTPCQWLSVSPLNLYRHGIKQAGNQNQPFADDAAGRFVRTKYNATVADELTFDNATYAMARKLTRIPFTQLAMFTFRDVVMYADEYEDTSGQAERKAKVRVTYYGGSSSSSPIGQFEFPVAQQSAIKISDDLYIERYEEAAMTLQPGMHESLQGTQATSMQWGYSGQVLYGNADRYTNGNYLTANAVYTHVQTRNGMNAPIWETPIYDKYRAKYPQTGNPITEPATGVETESVYYYPVLTAKSERTTFFDPIYNSSAARYCHEKNRDANGNGVIDANEVVWYLPSMADMVVIHNTNIGLSGLSGSTWTSTEEDAQNSWAFVNMSGIVSAAKTQKYRVRCVKGKGVAALPEPTLSTYDSNTMSFTYAGGVKSITIQDRTGLPWTVTSSATQWLKFSNNNTGGGVADSYSGTNNGYYYVHATTNTNTAARNATITLTRRDTPNTKVITVTQAGYVPPATISPNAINLRFHAGESGAFSIDNKGTGVQWTVTANQPWLTIADDAIGTNAAKSKTGTGNTTYYAYVSTKNASTTANRTANITLTRSEMASASVAITQDKLQAYYPSSHQGWAASNIYWDSKNNRLTFDETNVSNSSYYQGVYFLWGSLVAISPVYPYNPTTSIIFAPTPASVNPNALPSIGTTLSAGDEQGRNIVLERHDPANNVGDICRYLTTRGWAPGSKTGTKWRLPTATEFKVLVGTTGTGTTALYAQVNRDGTANLSSHFRFQFPQGGFPLPSNGVNAIYKGQDNKQFGAGLGGAYQTGSWAGNSKNSWLGAWAEERTFYVIAFSHTLFAGVRCVKE